MTRRRPKKPAPSPLHDRSLMTVLAIAAALLLVFVVWVSL